MHKLFSCETRRAFDNKRMWAVLLFTFLLALAHGFLIYFPFARSCWNGYSNDYEGVKGYFAPTHLWSYWLGFDSSYTPLMAVVYLIIPILAAFPFADSFLQDRRSGYLKNLLTRVGRRAYGAAKYLAVFLASGTAAVSPLIFDLLLITASLPSGIKPFISEGYYAAGANSMFGPIFYRAPFLYILIFLVLDFVFFGALACLSLCVAFYVGNPFFVLMFPFMVYFLFCELCNILGFGRLSPASYLSPGQSYAIAGPGVILTETAVLLVFTCVFFNWKIRKIEVF